jgi:PST family polysaccharide transporter
MEKTKNEHVEKSYRKVKRKSVSGVIITGVISGIAMIGGFALSIVLSPQVFGIFTIVVATASFLAYFSDIGLAAALIQKKKEVTRQDLITTFTIQEILVFIIAGIALFLSGWIGQVRHFDADALFLFRILIFTFILSSLKTIPSVLLERDLEFGKLAIVTIVEVAVFYSVIITMALNGAGIEMFSYAILLRGLAGLLVIYIIKPWIPSLGLYKESAKKLITYGLPFQLNSLLALLKDQLFVMVLPFFVPLSAVGYIGWAKKWSEFPLRLVMDTVIRVTFPTYSRLQGDKERLSKGVSKTIYSLMIIILPLSVGMIFLVKPIIHIIPNYLKWEPALISFYLFTITSVVAGVTTPLLNAINAIGKIKISLYFMIFWTAFIWIVTPIMVSLIGFNGVAATAALMSLSSIAVVYVFKKYIAISLKNELVPSIVCSLIMGLALFIIIPLFDLSMLMIFISILIGALIYGLSYLLLFKEKFISEFWYIANIYRS